MSTDNNDHTAHHNPPREPQDAPTPERVMRGWWKNHHKGTEPPEWEPDPPVVIVWWWDAISYGTDNWTDHTETPEPCPTVTIGWQTHTTPAAITIVPLVNTHQWGNGITIPTGCIHHTRHLTPPPPPPTRRRRKP